MTVSPGIPQLLVVGLGNIPFPNTRHRFVPSETSSSLTDSLYSVGHLIVDALASRFGIRMSPNRALNGFTGRSHVVLGDSNVDLTLFKPSTSPLHAPLSPRLNLTRQSPS